jgi:exopolyphosphatase/guanosine-5'-triphosphate,3'-diphosphate pyrophosphatase
MSCKRCAVIDIGTNSVKLLVAEVVGQHVTPLWEDSQQTRLGRGFYETRVLQAESIASTAKAVAQFAKTARAWMADSIRVIATSAARDALNPQSLLSAVETATGLKVEIISGEREADWVFQGVTTDPELAKHPLLLLDVGGGSTEFILGHGAHKDFQHSFPLGTVRLLEQLPLNDPPTPAELAGCQTWLEEFLRDQVRPKLEAELRQVKRFDRVHHRVQLVGTGGTTTILARMEANLHEYDRAQIEATRLSLDQVRTHLQRLWNLPLAERQQIVGLPKNRADVILTGVAIYEAIMQEFEFDELRVSTRGLRFAAVMDGA